MRWARGVAIFVIVVMSLMATNILLNDSMGHGVGFDTFNAGVTSPWQAFINQDLVSGLILTVSWIIYRQCGSRVADTVAWVWMALWWGNIVVAAYVLLAVYQSSGDAAGFFTGRRAASPLRAAWTPSVAVRGVCWLGAVVFAAYLGRGLLAVHFGGIATIGYVLGFVPIVLSFVLLAVPARRAMVAATA